jgi:site-specific recombinase XerD
MSTTGPSFPCLLQDFFLQRLISQRAASQRTIESYRDTFEILLRFAEQRTGRTSSALTLRDLDAPLVLDFLDYLENERGNSPSTRNARLNAIRSFMRYAASRDPSALTIVQRILAIPNKRFDRPVLGFLSRDEMEAIINAPDRSTWTGLRDSLLFATLYNSGARVSELIGLRVADILLDRQSSLLLHGKGRKERVIPLWRSTAKQLRAWLKQIVRRADAPVFPNRTGNPLSRSGVRQRLQHAVVKAIECCPSLAGRKVSPHTIRHYAARRIMPSRSSFLPWGRGFVVA